MIPVGAILAQNLQFNDQTGTTYTFVIDDSFKTVTASNASAVTFTVPPNSSVAYEIGVQIQVVWKGVGQLTIAQGSGVTVRGDPGLKIRARYMAAVLVKIATDEWYLWGDTAA